MQKIRLVPRPLACIIAFALLATTGCNDKSAPSSSTTGTQAPPKMKMTTHIPP